MIDLKSHWLDIIELYTPHSVKLCERANLGKKTTKPRVFAVLTEVNVITVLERSKVYDYSHCIVFAREMRRNNLVSRFAESHLTNFKKWKTVQGTKFSIVLQFICPASYVGRR